MQALAEPVDAFLEAAGRVAIKRTMSPIRRRLERESAVAFRAQGADFVNRLARIQRLFPAVQEAAGADDWEPLWDSTAAATEHRFRTAIGDAHLAALLAAAGLAFADLESDDELSLSDPEIADYLHARATAQTALISHTTHDALAGLFTTAAVEGWSYRQTTRAISARFVRFAVGAPAAEPATMSRAALIAQFEVGDAAGLGTILAARQVAARGQRVEKRNIDMGDDRVDEECIENTDAGWIPIDAAFPTGDLRPLYHVSCRCVNEVRLAV